MLRIMPSLWLHRSSFSTIPNETLFRHLAPCRQSDTQRGKVHSLEVLLNLLVWLGHKKRLEGRHRSSTEYIQRNLRRNLDEDIWHDRTGANFQLILFRMRNRLLSTAMIVVNKLQTEQRMNAQRSAAHINQRMCAESCPGKTVPYWERITNF